MIQISKEDTMEFNVGDCVLLERGVVVDVIGKAEFGENLSVGIPPGCSEDDVIVFPNFEVVNVIAT